MAIGRLIIRGAREHNLKNIDIELPLRKIIAVTGVSGSGKSSLAFDTIYAEGQRRYIESLSTYARQFIEKLERPDLDGISGISPTIAIQQKNTVTTARSTVGTSTEIYDYLRLLFARAGRIFCPNCGIQVKAYTPSDAASETLRLFRGGMIYIIMPGGNVSRETWKSKKSYLVSRGYARLVVNGEPMRIEEYVPPERGEAPLEVLLDRVEAAEPARTRIAEAVESAYRELAASVEIADPEGGRRFRFSQLPACTGCGKVFDKPAPILFSFNSPYGACPDCKGFGDRMEFSEEMIVPDRSRSLREKTVDPWSRERFEYFHSGMIRFCRRKGIDLDAPWSRLSREERDLILEGEGSYIGVIPFLEKMKEKSYKTGHRFFTRRYMGFSRCRTCRGTRLRKEAQYVKIGGRTISDLASMTPALVLEQLEKTDFSDMEREISRDIMGELSSRLRFLDNVGLGYLTLDRLTRSLSGGEAQRINLANALGANLVDTLYVLDEPSVGLHAADSRRLIEVMWRLRDLGNTVMVVEHDPEIILASDHIVDLGPGPGTGGGRVLFNGSIGEAGNAAAEGSKTLEYLFPGRVKRTPQRKRRRESGYVSLKGVTMHNLKKLDVRIPLGNLVCVTGVSGSGKSTLVVDVLYRVLTKGRERAFIQGVNECRIEGTLDKVLLVDQSPIGATPRSNPITYIKGFSHIREIFASQRKSVSRGYSSGRFSFNRSGGRCPRCEGMGFRRIEMHFMADVFVPCEVCEGKRYSKETLEVDYKGKNISEVLDMTVDEAIMFFDGSPQLGEKLWTLSRVGLGYLKLGQPSDTLSGGEAQRIKIARELAESGGERNLYIMDEPTTGLHMCDVGRLLSVMDELLDAGHSILVIEHNMEVIASADYIVDLGPGGGEEGGRVIACGDPREIVRSKESRTGKYLASYMAKYYGRD